MSVELRIMLIVGSVLMLVYMIKKVRKSKLQIEYTVFWIIFGVLLIIISLFPQIMYLLAKVIGVQSPVNGLKRKEK